MDPFFTSKKKNEINRLVVVDVTVVFVDVV
jgi:hypothetical protein